MATANSSCGLGDESCLEKFRIRIGLFWEHRIVQMFCVGLLTWLPEFLSTSYSTWTSLVMRSTHYRKGVHSLITLKNLEIDEFSMKIPKKYWCDVIKRHKKEILSWSLPSSQRQMKRLDKWVDFQWIVDYLGRLNVFCLRWLLDQLDLEFDVRCSAFGQYVR